MHIRDERTTDLPAISAVIEQAFGRADEARLVDRLRRDGDAVASLVAESEGVVVGHVMLSLMSAPFRALGLVPLSVGPKHQRQGVGAALTRAAIARAQSEGCHAVFVLGDPAYYGRFGFRADLAADFTSPYPGRYFMVLPLQARLPAESGRIDYAPAFAALE